MMKSIRRLVGTALVVVSLLGLILTAAGLVVIPGAGRQFRQGAAEAVDLALLAVNTTDDSLDIADNSLDATLGTLDTLQSVVRQGGRALDDTDPLLESLTTLAGQELPATIESLQLGLASAEESAAVIDQLLSGLNAISALTGLTYNPPVPLAESIRLVSESLQDLPGIISGVEGDLDTARVDLESVSEDVTILADDLDEVRRNVAQTRTVIDQYRLVVDSLRLSLTDLHADLPSIVRWGVWGVSLVLVWLLVTQVGLLYQGWEMMTGPPGPESG
jgi:hypothetical protein